MRQRFLYSSGNIFHGYLCTLQRIIQDLEFFFCNVVLEIPFIFLVLHVNWSNFDLLTSHIKTMCISL